MPAFAKELPLTPAGVGRFALHVAITIDDAGQVQGMVGTYDFDVVGADFKAIRTRVGDALPHLTTGQITAATNLLTALRGKANTEVMG